MQSYADYGAMSMKIESSTPTDEQNSVQPCAGIDPARLTAAKDLLDRAGISVRDWAQERGFPEAMVYTVLRGHRPCKRGLSHRIAVALGIKDSDAPAQANHADDRMPALPRARALPQQRAVHRARARGAL